MRILPFPSTFLPSFRKDLTINHSFFLSNSPSHTQIHLPIPQTKIKTLNPRVLAIDDCGKTLTTLPDCASTSNPEFSLFRPTTRSASTTNLFEGNTAGPLKHFSICAGPPSRRNQWCSQRAYHWKRYSSFPFRGLLLQSPPQTQASASHLPIIGLSLSRLSPFLRRRYPFNLKLTVSASQDNL